MREETNRSILTLEDRKKIALTGVSSVDSFSETAVNLTVNGMRVQIIGTKLKVLSFSQGSGNFSACGEVTQIKYGGAKGKFFSRLFK